MVPHNVVQEVYAVGGMMNWEAIGAVGEIVGAITVVVTLIYLAIQMRQNTTAIQLSTSHSVTEELQEMFSLLASDQSLSEIFVQAAQTDELSDADRVRYNTFLSNVVRVYENAFLQKRQNVLDEAHWAGMTRMMIDLTAMPAFSFYWADRMHWLSEDFQQHMNTEIIPTPAKPGINMPGNYSLKSKSAIASPVGQS